MKYPNKDYIEHLRRKYPPGTRLQLSCMEDEFPVPPGSMGTVECIDDAGQIHVDWDCGRSLALILIFHKLPFQIFALLQCFKLL